MATGAKGKGRPVPTEAHTQINKVLKTSASVDTYYARSATVVGMGELLLFFGKEFTASELYDYFTKAPQLVAKREHSRTNPVRRQQSLQHHEMVGVWGLGPKTPQGSADAKEVAAVAEAIGGKAEKGKGRPVAAPPAEGDPPADGAPPAERAPSDECWNWRGNNWRRWRWQASAPRQSLRSW